MVNAAHWHNAVIYNANMALERKTHFRGALAVQGLIALAVIVFVLTPAQGGMALYLPLAALPTSKLAWSRTEHTDYLAAGPYAGTAFVRVTSPAATLTALRHGALLIAVPASLCGAPPRDTPS